MYMRFFGLKQEPFSLAPDPRYLYMSKRHREALAHLLYGVGGGGGFVLLSGEIGAGKTTVCRCFLEQIPKRCNVAYIFNPKLTVLELVQVGVRRVPDSGPAARAASPPTVKTYVDALNEFLLKTHAVGQNNVLIIDEAQMLSVDVLEQLRLLTNLETNERKLLQIVLIGQPELRTMLERPELEQLAQRVIARFHLKALSSKETEHYIRHRLSVAGMTRSIPFDRKALQRIHEIARGVPRRINLLCDRAMLGAYAHGKTGIDSEIVEKAAREVFGKSEPNGPDRARLGTGAGLGLVVATGLALTALLAFAIYGAYRKFAAPTPPVAAASAPRAAGGGIAGSARRGERRRGGVCGAARDAAAAASVRGARRAHRPGERAGTRPGAARRASPPRRPPRVAAGAGRERAGRARRDDADRRRPDPRRRRAEGAVDRARARREDGLARARSAVEGRSRQRRALRRGRAPAGALLQVRDHPGDAEEPRPPRLPRPARRDRADDARGPDRPARRHRDLLAERPGAEGLGRRRWRKLWQGEFGTLWRTPPGYTGALGRGCHRPARRPARDPARRTGRRAGAAAAPDPGCGAARRRSCASRRRTA